MFVVMVAMVLMVIMVMVVVLLVRMVMGHGGNVCNIGSDVYGLGGDNDDSVLFCFFNWQ